MSDFTITRVLAQNRPSGTGNTTAYTKTTRGLVTITSIVACNTTGSSVAYSVFICTNGTTYDQTTAIVYQTNLAANETQTIDMEFTLDTASGTVGVQSATGNAINFTILGKIKEVI